MKMRPDSFESRPLHLGGPGAYLSPDAMTATGEPGRPDFPTANARLVRLQRVFDSKESGRPPVVPTTE